MYLCSGIIPSGALGVLWIDPGLGVSKASTLHSVLSPGPLFCPVEPIVRYRKVDTHQNKSLCTSSEKERNKPILTIFNFFIFPDLSLNKHYTNEMKCYSTHYYYSLYVLLTKKEIQVLSCIYSFIFQTSPFTFLDAWNIIVILKDAARWKWIIKLYIYHLCIQNRYYHIKFHYYNNYFVAIGSDRWWFF